MMEPSVPHSSQPHTRYWSVPVSMGNLAWVLGCQHRRGGGLFFPFVGHPGVSGAALRSQPPRPRHQIWVAAPGTSTGFHSHTIRKWCRAAGLKGGCAYGLRHTFGTKQGEIKTNQAVIAQTMGHSSISTTMRYMANNSPAHEQAITDMEKAMQGVLSQRDTDAKTPQKLSPHLSRGKTPTQKSICEINANI